MKEYTLFLFMAFYFVTTIVILALLGGENTLLAKRIDMIEQVLLIQCPERTVASIYDERKGTMTCVFTTQTYAQSNKKITKGWIQDWEKHRRERETKED